ncbi:MAG: hypothetical protein A3I88_01325 [Candidatus Portnoybacteria bacterium RIFCSPLOWO2_12_FULL_39_9]|uniref:TGS domain-containing protein n=1 Tax=Candidatus Portnoybacteria bacterium RIFCSPHIGHO2_12_FULL_38_9 TaxID=1801997 RepID=A0A1G2FHH5_9BACT|nr:MAG: hypothetical protein A3H00_01610 [Candidatus Portnoybacteria bacterium RBG_13_40_8]OGZ36621.1 MAG: hypothetical protein A2646_00385 [Candidatus Portnoybacteria bacterium RIFCSPHIGHO2_02_FULL_39_12]OGZ37515.1 MAG: hypothetical protein A3J64_00810 [Candidatus Portnoybacteria bacterium RIFCSPHIGHO2_12_FULL_38_9]OGZ39365.1 MAG: hypothetical protein A3F21_02780 [Candidatus Portnoybacteria bacterium RIFCSPLOWO2_01_FULL_38_39]OGZ39855.1 MAG: hypothetical protein A3I88_01325 [Candidatus Portnoy
MANIQQILKNFKEYNPSGDAELIKRAYEFALRAHQGQKRLSGEDYISHCLAAAKTLVNWRLDSETIAAALLHDIDDTKITSKELKEDFGENISKLVEGCFKLDKIKYQGGERRVENFRKLILATAEDIRVILIKLSDRLHNMKTLSILPKEKQKRIALETLEIYAPIANRLGMGELKGQLEDLSFPYVYPRKYQLLINTIKEKYKERAKYLKNIKEILKKELEKNKVIIADIHSRAKHQYSLYKKLIRYEKDLDKIYDLVALRVIVPDKIEDCYKVLGIIHQLWKPLPGRIKDYIALPKPNGYQSLHTTVFTLDGRIVEIQIRTEKMHRGAEYGVAAHWYYEEEKGLKKYFQKFLPFPQILSPIQQILSPPQTNQKEKLSPHLRIPSKRLNWVRNLQKWQTEKFDSPEEFFKSLKIDFFKNRIFIFTPKGEVIDLPEGATPIDFAYSVHTEIGHHCGGAKIDGKLSSLAQPLQNGQIVEIIPQKNKKPSRDWLRFVKTGLAKKEIKSWLKKQNRTLKNPKN